MRRSSRVSPALKLLVRVFPAGHLVIVVMFLICAFALSGFAVYELWGALEPWADRAAEARLDAVLDSMALLIVAVAALELGQTLVEEEIQRDSHMSSPSRVRRFLSRFLVVLVVALAIEALVATIKFAAVPPHQPGYDPAIGVG